MRPVIELFELRKDSHQLTNDAGKPEYATVEQDLRSRVEKWMQATHDPRVDPKNDAWDQYPYFGGRVVDEHGNPVTGKACLSK